MRAARGPVENPWLDRWEELLDGPLEMVLDALTSPTPRAREMRQSFPFAGLLAQDERHAVLSSFSADDRARSRSATR